MHILPYPRPPVRGIDVMDVARAYEAKVIDAVLAARVIAKLSRPDRANPVCRHGIHSYIRLNDAPCCPLCLIDYGYETPEEVRL